MNWRGYVTVLSILPANVEENVRGFIVSDHQSVRE